jgi:hypothetical protein
MARATEGVCNGTGVALATGEGGTASWLGGELYLSVLKTLTVSEGSGRIV